MRMRMADNHPCVIIARPAHDLDIQFIHLLLQVDVYTFLMDHGLSFLQAFGGEIPQHFQTVSGLPDKRTQSNGNRQTRHAGPRDAHSHRVFQDIRAQMRVDAFRFTPQDLGGLGRGQRDRDRFRASYSRNHLLMHQPYNP